ncbi:hypothetical protein F7725_006758 [Dissostichus mawsoni]|uniref:Organic solute transporter subunit alpha n=1 Tax=Dissostichus mawsoni TaxID=36200 RepID=A0A7J5XUT0_DISMA|nr:hypothetical protein F7725_006758 [Dissostichus mawsoni]
MDEALNITIDPACLQDPPLAIDVIKQLDVFDFCLYLMLTFMACVSLLLYLEQCAYIYKNLPYPKKTTLMWISVVVYKVLVLMIEELGGTNDFLQRFSTETFRINTGPCCCCCACLPRVHMSRRLLFFLKLGALQYAILKTVLSILSIVLEITGTAIWINPFIGILTIASLWPVAIIFMNVNSHLRSINLVPKYAIYQLILVLSQLQTSIINILALDGTIACAPPFSSQARGSMLSQQMMIMEMFILTLINQRLYRRTYDALPSEEAHDNNHNAKVALQTALVEHDV